MMDYKAIEQIIRTAGESGLSYLQIETEGMKITMKKGTDQVEDTITTKSSEERGVVNDSINGDVKELEVKKEPNTDVNSDSEVKVTEKFKVVRSPIVGTFYASSGPDAEEFVKVGSKVKKGQILCIIEAMKLMNEIESEFDGEIVEVLVKSEQMVEYSQELFRIL